MRAISGTHLTTICKIIAIMLLGDSALGGGTEDLSMKKYSGEPNTLRMCQDGKDCVMVERVCDSPIAINKKFEKKYNERTDKRRKSMPECETEFMRKYNNPQSFCSEEGICSIREQEKTE